MHLSVPIVTDIIALSHDRQLQTDLRLQRENAKRSRRECVVGQNVCVNNHFSSSDKMKPAWKGPFPVLQVHADGTVAVQRGQIHERVSVHVAQPQ